MLCSCASYGVQLCRLCCAGCCTIVPAMLHHPADHTPVESCQADIDLTRQQTCVARKPSNNPVLVTWGGGNLQVPRLLCGTVKHYDVSRDTNVD